MHKSRILIVDDDPLIRDVLSAIFPHSGSYWTGLDRDGLAGLKKIRQNDVDVVFTDISMPEMNGISQKCIYTPESRSSLWSLW
jgi:CheY-like chemotaxis protein